MFEWQTLAVAMAIAFAGLHAGWRGWLRISSVAAARQNKKSSCGLGCDKCSE